jgi:hypothetical protein
MASLTRCPDYPYVNLAKAVNLVRNIYPVAKGHPINTQSLFMKLGFNGMTASARETLAALKYYGFVYEPHGTKEVGLTEAALLMFNGVLGSKEQNNAIQQAFFSPAMYAYCWQLWGNDDVSEEVMRSHLVLRKSFSAASLTGFISGYRESREFSGIGQNVETEKAGDSMVVPDLGELIPIDEFIIEDTLPLPLPEVKQETFTLSDGGVSIYFPSEMSREDFEDFEDFEDWLDILKRKVKRSVSVVADQGRLY